MTGGPIAILGSDGYTGWALTCHLLDRGYYVVGADNCTRRRLARPSVTPLKSPGLRQDVANETYAGAFTHHYADITDLDELVDVLSWHEPSTVVNLAQIPSAPYSMRDVHSAWQTQENNVRGALNLMWAINELDLDAHVVQLATIGEYGTPDAPIPEGFLDDGRPAPKDPGSFYHASKVNTTVNTYFASKTWDIPTTEIYQGIVYGLPPTDDDALLTRFDVDAVWGTVLNRFTAQAAIGEPLTVYGKGGQKRAMLSIDDCLQCLTLAIEHPPDPDGPGRYPYRAINQFDETHRVRHLAEGFADYTGAEIAYLDNPRAEDDSDHVYEPERDVLDRLGYEPSTTIDEVFERTHAIVKRYEDRIDADELQPTIRWDGTRTVPNPSLTGD